MDDMRAQTRHESLGGEVGRRGRGAFPKAGQQAFPKAPQRAFPKRTGALNSLGDVAGDALAGLFDPSAAGVTLGVVAAAVIGAALILPKLAGEKPAKR
jgi:hypothetical protein